MKRNMKYYILLTVAIMAVAGCESNRGTTDAVQSKATETLMAEAQRQIGLPNIVNWQQRKLLAEILELCDQENLICYAYIKSDYSGQLTYLGRCIGYGIPFSAQFTNPLKIADYLRQGGYAILPQPDPNGLFMPTSSSATWLIMVDPEDGMPHPVYMEPEIVVSPFPLPSIPAVGTPIGG